MNKAKVCCGISVLLLLMLPLAADANGKGHILLLWQHSDFKSLLSSELQDTAPDGYSVTAVDDYSQVKKADFNGYNGVIIINRGMAGHMNGKAKQRIKESADAHIVSVTTFGNPDTSKDDLSGYSQVDAVTTASLQDRGKTRELALEIWRLVEKAQE